ncbi:CooT family nickel-binding protein [Thermococcus sp. M39]|uniref:CooT family nickel-binding protein n=1 Tax=unclassified Thermococcus TaxID=2627626 RepID=UPI00143C8062|nr:MULTISPECIES: CooT family nickel-binding protein [unclassified Thermococcus]NJE08815.1 CooT family nickel-binding protein [Thermococcus sp. M39]NJE13476.1 CooT family nickel-binding protein [Thermococcus sp. LS2]
MCQSKVIVLEDGKAEVVMTDVTLLEVKDGKIVVKNLLGKELVLEGYEIDYIDFISHRIYLRLSL